MSTGKKPTPRVTASSGPLPPENEVNQQYRAILVDTLTAPDVRERLIATQTLNQKWKFIQLHKLVRSSEGGGTSLKTWGEKETALLRAIDSSRSPDIQSLLNLKVFLSSASRDFMQGFLEANGVAVLTKVVLQRVNNRNFGVIDAALVYEALLCCKLVMNNALGMKGFLSSLGSIDAIALCLKFDFKHLSLLVLEILTVTCFSESATKSVLRAMHVLAKTNKQPVYSTLAEALVDEDIEVKNSVLALVHHIILNCDHEDHTLLRRELDAVHFEERCHEATRQIEREFEYIQVNTPSSPMKSLKSSKASMRMKMDFSTITLTSTLDITAEKIKHGDLIALKNLRPSHQTAKQGDSAASLPESSGRRSSASGLSSRPSFSLGSSADLYHSGHVTLPVVKKNFIGAAKVKGDRCWASLDPEHMTILESVERPLSTGQLRQSTTSVATTSTVFNNNTAMKLQFSISQVMDVRTHTTDAQLLKLAAKQGLYIMEILLSSQQATVGFGCETLEERDLWVNALRLNRDQTVVSKSSYYMQRTQFELEDALRAAKRFDKLYNEYLAFIEEAQEAAREELLITDEQDLDNLFTFLHREALATGQQIQLQQLLQELLLLPSEAGQAWVAINKAVKNIRRLQNSQQQIQTHEEAMDEYLAGASFQSLLQQKIESEGGPYKQMSKLAQDAIAAEQQVKALRLELDLLKAERALTAGGGNNFTDGNRSMKEQIIPIALQSPRPPPGSMLNEDTTELSHLKPFVNKLYEQEVITLNDHEVALRVLDSLQTEMTTTRNHKSNLQLQLALLQQALQQSQAEIVIQDDDGHLQRFEKMKQQGLPRGTIRLKMAQEGVVNEEIDAFFAACNLISPKANASEKSGSQSFYGGSNEVSLPAAVKIGIAWKNGSAPPTSSSASTAAAPAVAVEPDPRYEKFVKMKKMLPEGAVRQKMGLEGFTDAEIDSFIANGPPAGAALAAAPTALAPAADTSIDPRYEKFIKMKKMLPEGAVRQKMGLEGFTDSEIDYFLANGPPAGSGSGSAAAPQAPPIVEAGPDPRYEKFIKMKEMLPEGAVRQKMGLQGFTDAEVDYFMKNGPPPASAAAAAPVADAAPAAVDPRLEKFIKMKKMLPEGAVRQKMSMEGFTDTEIDTFMSGQPMPVAGAAPAPAAAPVSAETAEKMQKYIKMKTMLPEGAIRQKMAMDGISDADIDAFFGVTSSSSATSAAKPNPLAGIAGGLGGLKKAGAAVGGGLKTATTAAKAVVKIAKSRTKSVYWTKLNDNDLPNTIWTKLPPCALDKTQETLLEEWFSSKPPAVTIGGGKPGGAKNGTSSDVKEPGTPATPATPALISVLDSKRQQNVMIVMGKLRKDAAEIKKMILDLDPKVLTAELTANIKSILPTKEEEEALKAHTDPSKLDAPSRLFFHLCEIPRLNERIESHEIAYQWGTHAQLASNQLTIVQTACDELHTAMPSLSALLSLILAVGNFMNDGTKFGEASGIKLDALAKLVTVKGVEASRGSLLNCVALMAQSMYHKPDGNGSSSHDLLRFADDWKAIWAAADLSLKQILGDVNSLEAQVNRLNNEFIRIKDGTAAKDNAELATIMAAQGPAANGFYKRLADFLNEAKPVLARLKAQSKAAESTVEAAMQQFGEKYTNNGTEEVDPCKKFFSQFSDFAHQMQAAHEQNERKKKAEERQRRAAAEAALKLEAKQRAASLLTIQTNQAKGLAAIFPPAEVENNVFNRYHEEQQAQEDEDPDSVRERIRMKAAKSKRYSSRSPLPSVRS